MSGFNAARESQLLERLALGDEASFEALFRAHYPHLLRFARSRVDHGEDAEDVVHDVLLNVWRQHTHLTVRGSLRSYLLAAVHNRSVDLARHRAVAAEVTLDAAAPLPVGAASRVDDPAETAELDGALRDAVARLPERARTAFLLCRDQELTYAEAAAVMGVSHATVKTQVARSLAAIREALAPFLLLLLGFVLR